MKLFDIFKLNLQLFADGGDGGGESGGDTGDNGAAEAVQTPDAGETRLLELGVPADKIRKKASKSAGKSATQTAAAKDETPDVGNPNENPGKRMTWDEIMADPEYNKQMQSIVQQRLKGAKSAQEQMEKLSPALELLARKYGMDTTDTDYEALAKAINDDSKYYEDKALEMGVPVETAMEIDKNERESARRQKEEEQTVERQKIQEHLGKLQAQGEELKKTFPGFDLATELQNPAFARMTAPNVGISVADAYYAVHRNEIQTASMQATAQKTQQKVANSIRAGQARPTENGTSAQAPTVTSFDYAHASREQREALKAQIRQAAARGEKIYPGIV